MLNRRGGLQIGKAAIRAGVLGLQQPGGLAQGDRDHLIVLKPYRLRLWHALSPRFCGRQSCGTVAGIAIRTSTDDYHRGNYRFVEFPINSAMVKGLQQALTASVDCASEKGPGINWRRAQGEELIAELFGSQVH